MREHFAASLARTVAAVLVGVTVSVTGMAEDSTSNVTQLQTQAPKAAESKVFGTLDMRGEYYVNDGSADTANYAELGYQFNPNTKLSWYQGFDTNISKSSVGDGKGGLNAVLDQGYLRARFNNLLKTDDWALHYEARVFAPTWGPEIAQGNITRFHNALKLVRTLTPSLKVTLQGIATPQVFRVAGVGNRANPYLQTRVYLMADLNITSKLSLNVPVLWYQTHNREFAGATNSGATEHLIYIYPELDYALTDHVTLGLAYQSGNLMKADLSAVTIGDGLKNGNVQFAVITSI